MLPNGSTCVANQYDEQSKDPVIDDARKNDQQSVAIFRSRTKSIRNSERARHRNDREPSRIPHKKTLSLFHKGKVIKGFIVHHLRKNVPSYSELRKYISPAFRKYMTLRMCTARLQVRRDKSSVEAGSNCRLYLINRRTAKHKKTSSVLLCSQNKYVTKRSIKLNKQNEKHISFVNNVDHCWSS